jgi:hypothetical protein
MKLVPNDEIFGKICTLIRTAKKEMILVSPYNDVKDWDKLKEVLRIAKKNKIEIEWYSRRNNVKVDNIEGVRSLGIEPILIDNLHLKMYLNEDTAVVTSFNMMKTSYNKSLEIAYVTETIQERNEVFDYFESIKYSVGLNQKSDIPEPIPATPPKEDIPAIVNDLPIAKAIYDLVKNNYGKYEFRVGKNDNYYKKDQIDELKFRGKNHWISFTTHENFKSIKMLIIWTKNSDTIHFKEDSIYSVKDKLLFGNEIECKIEEDNKFIKYYYGSKIKLPGWDKMQIERYIADIELILNQACLK